MFCLELSVRVPLERALMRSRLPEVTVPECGGAPWEMLAALRRGMYFEAVAITEEDRARHAWRGLACRNALTGPVTTAHCHNRLAGSPI